MFSPGTLWPRVDAVTAAALRSGALQTIPTTSAVLVDRGIPFAVRVVGQLARKAAVRTSLPPGVPPPNPFLPYDPALFVAEVTPRHVCLLNKYNVVERHLLIVTRHFEGQQTALNASDFAALARCMAEGEGVGFYNSGPAAGASQPHKHLQWVPVSPADLPLAASIDAAAERHLGRADCFRFEHAIERLRSLDFTQPDDAGQRLADTYRRLLAACGFPLSADPSAELPSYNLVVTREWMLLTPRRRECFAGISLNALAFVGALLVKDVEQLDTLRRHGPWVALEAVARPHASGGEGT